MKGFNRRPIALVLAFIMVFCTILSYQPIKSNAATTDKITIAEARAVPPNNVVTVEGVVTFVSGTTYTIQDATGGIALYLKGLSSTPKLGDDITVTGTRTTYNGLQQITVSSIDNMISEGVTMPEPIEITLEQLIANDYTKAMELESVRVKITNASLGTTDTTTGYTPLNQGSSSMSIYKMPSVSFSSADMLDVIAVLSVYSKSSTTTYQLRVAQSSDITLHKTKPTVADDLFFSEYIEGSSNNKALEIYNGTGETIDLSKYTIALYANGNTTATNTHTFAASTTIASGETYVLYNSKAAADILTVGESSSTACNFNGDDAIALYNDGVLIDSIGTIGNDPGTEWSSGVKSTLDKTLVRMASVTSGGTTFNFDEWECYDRDTFAYLGTHTMTDGTITEKAKTPTSSVVSGSIIPGSQIELSSETKGAQIYYSIDDGKNYSTYAAPITVTQEMLPLSMKAYTQADGYYNSDVVTFSYTQVQVAAVTASPNGGAVVQGAAVKLSCSTNGAGIFYSLDNGTSWTVYDPDQRIVLDELPATIQAKATLTNYRDSEVSTFSYTLRENENYNIYFGQLHSHTDYSDGAGSCEEAFQYASSDKSIDFLAVTDHSNSFDNDTMATLNDGSMSAEWVEGQKLADQYTTSTFVGIFGYEMTWSNGLGHINTFNTSGFLSRNMSDYKASSALQNYYSALKIDTDSISQFNHPGNTFGDFNDFAYYDTEIDNQISLIEVGNGEGAVGSSLYFPSYEYYTRALDKGWHVAPTNNQDNHKSYWGNANSARTVVLADTLTRDNIYDAMRNMRVYATEDNDLEISYSLNGAIMGSILGDVDTADIQVVAKDPTDSQIGKVEVIVNGGIVYASKEVVTSSDTIHFELPDKYSYYYIKITQTDGNIAVTAPVWCGEVEKAGVSEITTTDTLPVKGESLDVNLGLYNNESKNLTIESIEFSVNDAIIHTVDLEKSGLTEVTSLGTESYSFSYTPGQAGTMDINVKVKAKYNGVEKAYTDVLKLKVVDPSMVTHVIIDGSHANDYVSGYYAGNMSNIQKIAAKEFVDVKVVQETFTEETLNDCELLIITPPAKKAGTTTSGVSYQPTVFDDEFIHIVKQYVASGKDIIVCGAADYQDSATVQSATEINKLLGALGASTRINSDEVVDDMNNASSSMPFKMFLTNFNTESIYTSNLVDGQKYSLYSGCSVLLDSNAISSKKAEWLVKGYDTTYSKDCKTYGDSYIEQTKGDIVAMAREELASGSNLFVSSAIMMSNYEVSIDMDNYGDLPYANKTIMETILEEVKISIPTTAIGDVRDGAIGNIYSIEGTVTAGTEEGNAFFDTIYVQDSTGGINIFPINEGNYQVGQKVKVIGCLDQYLGDLELRVISVEVTDSSINAITPEKISAKDAMDYAQNGGKLVKIEGKVSSFEVKNGIVESIYVEDASATKARVFIDGYISYSDKSSTPLEDIVKVGNTISVVGLISYDTDKERIRVRDRSEIQLISEATLPIPTPNGTSTVTNTGTNSINSSTGTIGTSTNTGDESLAFLYGVLMIGAMIGIVWVRKKKMI